MAALSIFGLLLIAVNVIGQQTNFDCNQRPPFTPDVKNCCKRPALNLGKYKELCSQTKGPFGGSPSDSHVFMNPCAVECIYTKGGAFSNGRFNMPKMNAFLNEIMPSDPDLSRIIFAGFQQCGPEVFKKIQEFEEKRQKDSFHYPGAMPPCSPFAVLTTFCAMRYTFINCPADLWTSSEACSKAQNYVKNCEPMAFGLSKNNH